LHFDKAPIDDTTKNLLLVALSLLGVSVTLGSLRAALAALRAKMASGAESAGRLVVSSAFFLLVFLAARAILEKQ